MASGTLTLGGPVKKDTVISDGPEKLTQSVNAPAWDPKKPFAQICGEPGIFYVQGSWFYSRSHQPIRPAPPAEAYNPAPKQRTRAQIAAEAEREVQKKVVGKFVPPEPESVVSARREDMRARAAEDQAA